MNQFENWVKYELEWQNLFVNLLCEIKWNLALEKELCACYKVWFAYEILQRVDWIMKWLCLAYIYIGNVVKKFISLKTNEFVEYSTGAGGVRESWSTYMHYIVATCF